MNLISSKRVKIRKIDTSPETISRKLAARELKMLLSSRPSSAMYRPPTEPFFRPTGAFCALLVGFKVGKVKDQRLVKRSRHPAQTAVAKASQEPTNGGTVPARPSCSPASESK